MFDSQDDSSPIRMPPVDQREVFAGGRIAAGVVLMGMAALMRTVGLGVVPRAIVVLAPSLAALIGWMVYRRSRQ
jgi:hypothetical protein